MAEHVMLSTWVPSLGGLVMLTINGTGEPGVSAVAVLCTPNSAKYQTLATFDPTLRFYAGPQYNFAYGYLSADGYINYAFNNNVTFVLARMPVKAPFKPTYTYLPLSVAAHELVAVAVY